MEAQSTQSFCDLAPGLPSQLFCCSDQLQIAHVLCNFRHSHTVHVPLSEFRLRRVVSGREWEIFQDGQPLEIICIIGGVTQYKSLGYQGPLNFIVRRAVKSHGTMQPHPHNHAGLLVAHFRKQPGEINPAIFTKVRVERKVEETFSVIVVSKPRPSRRPSGHQLCGG